VALDGTKIKANASKHKAMSYERMEQRAADIATKSLRKAKATISANGTENVSVLVQGKLKGNEIVDCGLVAQAKTPKPVEVGGA
jgi:hypothetical protein